MKESATFCYYCPKPYEAIAHFRGGEMRPVCGYHWDLHMNRVEMNEAEERKAGLRCRSRRRG